MVVDVLQVFYLNVVCTKSGARMVEHGRRRIRSMGASRRTKTDAKMRSGVGGRLPIAEEIVVSVRSRITCGLFLESIVRLTVLTL